MVVPQPRLPQFCQLLRFVPRGIAGNTNETHQGSSLFGGLQYSFGIVL